MYGARCRIDRMQPLEFSFLPALVVQNETIGIPLQHFDFIMAAAYEDKGGAFVQVQCEAALYDGCKTIDGFALAITARSILSYFLKFA